MGISIIFLALFALAMISRGIIVARQQATLALQANFLLEEGAEAIRFIRDDGWTDNISGLSGTNYRAFDADTGTSTWQVSETPETIGIFTRSFTVSTVKRDTNDDISGSGSDDPNTRKFDVVVTWPGRAATSTRIVSFYLTNYFND